MKFLLLFLFVLSAHAWDNDVTHRPKSFSFSNGKAVFVDFQKALYEIVYDIEAKKAEVQTTFIMDVVEEGHPVFDLIAEPTSVTVNGAAVSAPIISTPSNETKVRVLSAKLPVGRYELKVRAPLTNLVEYTGSGVKSAFWVTDLEDRYYLERYIPCNFEYDRFPMTFHVRFKGLKAQQHIFANGKVQWINQELARIDFPQYFTVNSLYFHTTPVGSVELLNGRYKSIDGRDIPLSLYMAKGASSASTLVKFNKQTTAYLVELEKDYGPFPHASVTVYNASLAHMGLGGMEYAGATVTNMGSLGHELFHSYFARGVSPANGNAGWIDEALASWRDNGYNRVSTMYGSSRMAAHAPYTRKTDTSAYGFGARFMAHLDHKFAEKGGLKPFMQKLLEKRLFQPLFTEDFILEMETFFGEDLKALFRTYIYGGGAKSQVLEKSHFHRKMTPEELQAIL